MPVSIRQVGPCFAGEIEGIDMTQPLSPAEAEAIHAGMDRYAVLVIREQPMTPDQQLAFTLSLGEIEAPSRASLRDESDYRLPSTFADVSNLDKHDKPMATGSGIPTVRSRRSRPNILCCTRSVSRRRAAIRNSPICALPMTPWTKRPRERLRVLCASIRRSSRASNAVSSI